MGDVLANTMQAIELTNWCDAAAMALVCYDSILMFSKEVKHIWKKPWSTMSTLYVIVRYLGILLALSFWAFNANILMSSSVSVAVDKVVNVFAFIDTVVGDIVMAMHIYAMYLGSRSVLGILTTIVLARISLGLAVAVVILGPKSGLSATEWVISGIDIDVCGPDVNTTSSLPLAWDILSIIVSSLLFLLAGERFLRHASDARRTLEQWNVSDLMGMLAKDSIVYFFLNWFSTILLMIGVWGVPNNKAFFSIVTAYAENEISVLVPRLVISFRENYDKDSEPLTTASPDPEQHESQHGSQHGSQHELQPDAPVEDNNGHSTARRSTVWSEKVVFWRRTATTMTTMTDDDVELRNVDHEQGADQTQLVGGESE